MTTVGVACGALLVAPLAHAETGDPQRSEEVVANATRPTIVVTSDNRVPVELRLRYHSYFEGGDWTPPDPGELPHVTFFGGAFTLVTPDPNGRTVTLDRPSQDDEADDEPRLQDGTQKADGKYILTGRFTTSVDPRTISFGQGSLRYSAYQTIETDGPDYTYTHDQAAGSVPVTFKYGSTTSISAPATVPADPASLTISGAVKRFSPQSNSNVAKNDVTVTLQRVNTSTNTWEIIATADEHGLSTYQFDQAAIKQDPGATATYRVHYVGDDTTDSSNSPTITIGRATATAPSRPTSLFTTHRSHRVTVHWDGPSSNGGSALTGFQVKRSGGVIRNVGPTARAVTFRHLRNGHRYTFLVRAHNDRGYSPWARTTGRPRH